MILILVLISSICFCAPKLEVLEWKLNNTTPLPLCFLKSNCGPNTEAARGATNTAHFIYDWAVPRPSYHNTICDQQFCFVCF